MSKILFNKRLEKNAVDIMLHSTRTYDKNNM